MVVGYRRWPAPQRRVLYALLLLGAFATCFSESQTLFSEHFDSITGSSLQGSNGWAADCSAIRYLARPRLCLHILACCSSCSIAQCTTR